jgi:hypothetical protein
MKIDEKILNRLNELVDLGEKVLSTRRAGIFTNPDEIIDEQLAFQWVTSVQNILVKVFGRESEHFKNFTNQCEGNYWKIGVNVANWIV